MASLACASISLSASLVDALAARAEQVSTSLPVLLVSGWMLTLSRRTEREDLALSLRWPASAAQTLAIQFDDSDSIESFIRKVNGRLSASHTLQLPVELLATELDSSLRLHEVQGRVAGVLECPAGQLGEHLLASFVGVLQAMAANTQQHLGAVSALGSAERETLLRVFNDTAAEFPGDLLVHEVFERQVRSTPDAIAAVYEGESLTYAELNAQANRLARYLSDRGVRPDHVVGICMPRGVTMVIGLLGILKAGGAYMPLDPNYPSERLRYMLGDAKPRIILTHEDLIATLPASGAEVVLLATKLRELALYDDRDLSAGDLPDRAHNLVYVIYTSGSTGRPKGICMPHRAMVNLIEWHRRVLPCARKQRVLQFAALSFDVAFQETFSTLCLGGTLVLLDEWIRRDPRALLDLVSRNAVERLFLPPLMLQSIAQCALTLASPPPLKDVIVAGEQLRITPEIAAWFRRMQGCQLHNHYGPTETHVVTALTLPGDPADWPTLPSIGRPIANTQIYVLNRHQQPVPIGAVGEIYIGGAGVARCYLNRSDLTEQRFLSDPFSGDPAARLYATGDLARWHADGELEYLRRNDDQVKIRGFRIELGEVEAQLALDDSVKDVAVVAREDVPGQKRLIAYLTTRAGHAAADAEALRARLAAALPAFMIPSAFVTVPAFPVSPNGKLDRRALPAPGSEAFAHRLYEAPVGKAEQDIAAIWEQLLQTTRVSRHDNFLELGGHSLHIVQMIDQLRRRGWYTDARCVFETPTLANLAATLSKNSSELPVAAGGIPLGSTEITPAMLTLVSLTAGDIERIVRAVPGGAANIQDIYPLAPLQEGIWFHHLLDAHAADTYVRPLLFSVSSRNRLDSFIAALQRTIDRHDVLRTAVLWEHLPQPVQVVLRRAKVEVDDVEPDGSRDTLEQLEERMRPEWQRMDLRRAPLLHLQVAPDRGSSTWYALLQFHHLVCDNESLAMIFAEVTACLQDAEPPLPEPLPYREHVARVAAQTQIEDTEAFFRHKLGDIDEPTAAFGILDTQGNAARIEAAHLILDTELATRLRAEARRSRVSPATLFHAMWGLVVARTSSRDDVVFGTVLLGRLGGSASARPIVGMFINTLPVRLRLQDCTVAQLVKQAHQELVELLDHEQASLAVAQRCSGIHGSLPLFTALLNYQHDAVDAGEVLAQAEGVKVLASRGGTNYPMTLSVNDVADGFEVSVQTDRRIDPKRVIGYVRTTLALLLDALERKPSTLALNLPLLPADERRELLETFNATTHEYPRESLIHELFEEQAQKCPQALGLVCGEERLSYAALNERANQVARYLRRYGVAPGERVGIFLERGAWTVVAMLGVLKAGGAYVPLDTSAPRERLQYLLGDAAPKVVLSERQFLGGVDGLGIAVLALDEHWPEIAKEQGKNLGREGQSSESLAYVMYTSGSTGEPKGVMVCHRNLVNYATHIVRQFDVESGEGSLIGTSMNFDLSLTGLYPPLICGRAVRVCAQKEDLSEALLEGHGYAPVKLTPSHLAMLSVPAEKIAGCVKVLVLGGEPLQGKALRWWREHSPQTRIFNHYGPTETTVGCVVNEVEEEAEGAIPIGRPIANTRIYILDGQGSPVPIGVVGEIYIAGAGVACGYWNRPELTAQRFTRDPFSEEASQRMYRTGDLGRWRADGRIEYLGRNDHQVKIRGYRIELGEIESELLRHEKVREAAVIARGDALGEPRLVAYVTLREAAPSAVEELRGYLKRRLPQYMVPAAVVVLEQLPLTANGKLDRRALPEPDLQSLVRAQYEAPQGELEEALASIWQELLRVERVGRRDNFFELGGHSLHATRVITRVGQLLEVDLPLRLVFEKPTLHELSSCIVEAVIA